MVKRLTPPKHPTLELKTMKENYIDFILHTGSYRWMVGFISQMTLYGGPDDKLPWHGAIYDPECYLNMLGAPTYEAIEKKAIDTHPGYRIIRDGTCIRAYTHVPDVDYDALAEQHLEEVAPNLARYEREMLESRPLQIIDRTKTIE